MTLGKIGTTLGKEIIAWTRTSGRSLLATRPVKVNIEGLKYAPKLEADVVSVTKNINKKEYHDVVQNMIMQRKSMVNTVHEGHPVETTLRIFKDDYIGANREIRGKIMNLLGDEDAIYSSELLRSSTNKLDNLIKQGFLPKNVVLYRGATPYDYGLSDMSCKNFIKQFYKKGKLFKIPIYPKTSLERTIGEDFAKGRILFKINAPKGTPAIYMEKLGVPKTGNYANEEEILLARNLTYKFKSHIQKDGYDLIEVDIVSNKPFWKKIHEFWNEVNL